MKAIPQRRLLCAIYTRKSTEHNLDLAFNSLDAQREACEAYIKSQAHEGWRLIPDHYDDGAFSGASLEHPALQSLIDAISARLVDVVVVYKVDRLTRSLSDFAKLVELFDAHDVSFVSVTQSFNTTSSMGRLTLNVLLSFAQFEREVISERVRDKIAASKRKGLWLGGNVPLGYTSRNKRLEIVEAEDSVVRFLFSTYLQVGTVKALRDALEAKGISPVDRLCKNGKIVTGRRWTFGHLNYLLKNRCYVGEIFYQGNIYKADHDAIIDRAIFDEVQTKLAEQSWAKRRNGPSSGALLKGLLFDSKGNRMSPSHSNKKGIRYRYYVSQAILQGREPEAGNVVRVSAPDIEQAVIKAVIGNSHDDTKAMRDELNRRIERVVLERNLIRIMFRSEDDSVELQAVIEIPFATPEALRKGLIHEAAPQADKIDDETRDAVMAAIAKSTHWFEILEGGKTTIDDIARTENLTPRYIRRLLTLAFLSPKLIRAIANQTVSNTCTASRLIESLPLSWADQDRKFDLSS
jgi:site-specific DNA recombinase